MRRFSHLGSVRSAHGPDDCNLSWAGGGGIHLDAARKHEARLAGVVRGEYTGRSQGGLDGAGQRFVAVAGSTADGFHQNGGLEAFSSAFRRPGLRRHGRRSHGRLGHGRRSEFDFLLQKTGNPCHDAGGHWFESRRRGASPKLPVDRHLVLVNFRQGVVAGPQSPRRGKADIGRMRLQLDDASGQGEADAVTDIGCHRRDPGIV